MVDHPEDSESIIKKITVGEFAVYRVVAIEKIGAFLDWGQDKDLFLPFAEQTVDLDVDQKVVIFTYFDNMDRIAASMRLNRNKTKFPQEFVAGDQVDLIIARETELGIMAIINSRHIGMLFYEEIFQDLDYGQLIKGTVKKIRPDGKIDLILGKTGHQAGTEIEPRILTLLTEKNGFLEITDKTPPEVIYDTFGVSKKKFKIAIGGLYKKRLIQIEKDGIRMVATKPSKAGKP